MIKEYQYIKRWLLYRHTSPSGKIYIGITSKKDANLRWQNGKGYYSCKHFYNAILKYGWDNIKHEVLFTNLEESRAKRLEIELIRHYKSLGISYNITNGGDGYTGPRTEKQRNVLRKLRLGTHLSEEQKAFISRVNKNKIVSEETRKKMSQSHLAKHKSISKEQKEIISKANKGKKLTAKHKEIISKTFSKELYQIDKITNVIINIYPSITEASKETGVFYGSISKCCNGITHTAGGFKWKFKNED